MSYQCLSKTFLLAASLAICAGAALAQPSDGEAADTTVSPAATINVRNPVAPAAKGDSLLWVHTGVAVQWAGTFSDWATSWKQPEGNPLLAQSGGQYAGRFYRTGTELKFALAGGITLASYAIAWKWPTTRKFVGILNMAMGGSFAAQAIRNAVVNPYYQP